MLTRISNKVLRSLRERDIEQPQEEPIQSPHLVDATKYLEENRFDDFLAVVEDFYQNRPFDTEVASKLARLSLLHIDEKAASASLALFMVNAEAHDPLNSKVLRKFKNAGAESLTSAVSYLLGNVPQNIVNDHAVKELHNFSERTVGFGNIDENTLICITHKVDDSLSGFLGAVSQSGCKFLLLNSNFTPTQDEFVANVPEQDVQAVEKVSLEHDESIFSQSDIYADIIFHHLVQTLDDVKLRDFVRAFEPALKIRIRDLISPFIREEHFLNAAVTSKAVQNVVIIGDGLPAEALASCCNKVGKPVAMKSGNTPLKLFFASEEPLESQLKSFCDALANSAPFENYTPKLAAGAKDFLLVVANLSDRQTWGNMLPLLPELANDNSLYVFPAPSNMKMVAKFIPQYAESAVSETFASGNVQLPKVQKKNKILSAVNVVGVFESLSSLAHDFQIPPKEKKLKFPWGAPKLSVKDSDFTNYALLKSMSLIERAMRHASHIAAAWTPIVAASKTVLVCPGRHLESTMIVCLANKKNIPTYELQNGTISDSGRFVKPITDFVFVNDAYSEKVYKRLGVKPQQIKLVGSPRIDNGLKGIRNISTEAAKKEVFGHRLIKGHKVVMLASQSLGPAISLPLFRMVAEAVKQLPDYTMLLRSHPSETKADLDAYKAELASIGLSSSRFIMTSRNLLELNASDIICTYYSTIGMEALALNKPVMCITLGNEPIPFDLCELGAKGPIMTVKDLVAQFENASATAFSKGAVPAFAQGQAVPGIVHALNSGA